MIDEALDWLYGLQQFGIKLGLDSIHALLERSGHPEGTIPSILVAGTNGKGSVAAMLDSITPADLSTLEFPGLMVDQYGWGHTGTVDGAKSCAWVMEGGRTIVVATVSGSRPSTGGKVCDIVTPSLALDLGIWADMPVRLPA